MPLLRTEFDYPEETLCGLTGHQNPSTYHSKKRTMKTLTFMISLSH